MMGESNISLLTISSSDKEWVGRRTIEEWGSELVIIRGQKYKVCEMSGFKALMEGNPVGLITYLTEEDNCMIITLNSWREGIGIGRKLIESVTTYCRQASLQRLRVFTTNDNLKALSFYQKLGFQLKTIYPDTISKARELKPEIPLLGYEGIPIRDEIELELYII